MRYRDTKNSEVSDTAFSYVNNNKDNVLQVLYSKLDGNSVVTLSVATLIDGTGDSPKPNAVVIVQDNKIIDACSNDIKYNGYYSHKEQKMS
jgi:hypothetical protein